MNSTENIYDPKLLDEVLHLRAENAVFYSEVQFLKEQNEFLKKIIETLISSRNA